MRGAGDFFVAGRRLSTFQVFATLLAANIGAGSTVGATGLAYAHGLSAWWWSGSAALGCVLLGLVVAPRLHGLASEHGFFTVGDFLEWRYDAGVRRLITAILWVGSLSILAGQLIAMAWALQVMAGVPKAAGCVLGGLVMIAYFTRGGLVAAVWVNLLELVVLLAGFALAVPYAWQRAGGWAAMDAAGGSPSYASPFGMGAAAILGLVIVFVPSFAISPGLVQKTYGARTAADARAAVLWNAACLLVFAFAPALLGMATRAVRPGLANAELALPVLMAELLPPWVGALGLLALLAAEISTADAVLFMLATSFARDLLPAFLRRDPDEDELLRAGRLASLFGGGLAIAAAIALSSVLDALKAFYAVMTVALFVPLMAGLLWTRATAGGARAAVAGGVAATVGSALLLRGTPAAGWAPYALGIGAAALACALVSLTRHADRR